MMPDPGILEPVFSVTCGKCRILAVTAISDEETGVAKTTAAAAKILERTGWKYSSRWGWTCPSCVKRMSETW